MGLRWGEVAFGALDTQVQSGLEASTATSEFHVLMGFLSGARTAGRRGVCEAVETRPIDGIWRTGVIDERDITTFELTTYYPLSDIKISLDWRVCVRIVLM